MILHPHVTGVVLAGGRATRMGGANKAMLPIGPAPHETTIARILRVFEGRFAGCIVAAPDPHPFRGLPAQVVPDRLPGCGPLGGLHAALSAVTTEFAFVCACDMPSLSGPLLDLMARSARSGRLLVPVRSGRPEPLHAIYPASCAPQAERALAEGVRMMIDFFARVPVDYLAQEAFERFDGALESFENLNTPEDIARWRR